MYHIVRQLKKHQSDIMIYIILVSPVFSTSDLEEFFKINTLSKSVWIIIFFYYFVLFSYYYYHHFLHLFRDLQK